MTERMDVPRLRELIDGVLAGLYQRYGHRDLPELCERLRLPPPPREEGTPSISA
ncbi:hypothetical protein ACIHCX_33875 [Streptomyces sp. NPDC052043]|uniref:hypothetical protein n=1 Tax=Streptomyces sp. NPDC052043 TaxID=3365684 RepID=UPI0037CE99E0